MLLTIFISIFGHIILIRTFNFLNSIHLLPKNFFKWIHLCSLTIIFLASIILKDNLIAIWLFYSIFILIPPLSLLVQEQIRKQIFKREIVNILDHLIILLKTGKSIREALLSCSQSYKESVKYYLMEVASAIQFEKKNVDEIKDKFFLEFLVEIVQISKSGHKQIDRLIAFRRKIKIQNDFRQKSRQVTLQIRTQAAILSLIYLILLFFTITQFGFGGFEKLYISSIAIYVIGSLIILTTNRGYRWKV